MAVKNLREFVNKLEQAGELIRVKEYVNPHLEMTEVVDRISKHQPYNKAILFENTGYDFPVLMNMMGNEKRMAMALGVNKIDEARQEIEDVFNDLSAPKEGLLEKLKSIPKLGKMASFMPKVVKTSRAECQEVIMEQPDLTKLPVLTCWPADGGPFITLPVVHTKSPNTGARNVGLYRVQVFDKDLTGMHWHKHKVSAGHFNEYKERGEKMPVAIVLGGDPLYSYSATAPLPPNVDEYMLAGFFRKKKVELVPCVSQPEIQVPIDADFVIEGYVDPEDDLIWEGPFGDHTGYYSLADYYPRVHVTAITHKRDAIYPATIVGIPPQEDAWIGKATERIFLAPIKMTMVPEIVDMDLPIEGVFHNLTIVKIKKEYPGQGQKVMNAMWGAGQMMFNKILVVVDEDIEITNYADVAKLLTKHVEPSRDIVIGTGPMDVLDHSCSAFAFGGKMGIDATKKLPEEVEASPSINNTLDASLINEEKIKEKFPEITGVNTKLLEQGISIVCVSFVKGKKKHAKKLAEKLFEKKGFKQVKMILFVDDILDIDNIADVTWRVSNNSDAKRDSFIFDAEEEGEVSHIAIDGTRKTKKYDNFQRDWPNIITSNTETIQSVDEKWERLGIGEFIPSPSLKYKEQQFSEGAIAPEEL